MMAEPTRTVAPGLQFSGMLRRCVASALTVVGVLAVALSATAHEEKRLGPVTLEVGWLQEPPYAGIPNAVQVSLSRAGRPLEGASLTAVVIFGDEGSTTRTEPLSLDPAPDQAGEYRAVVIPTRPGTYTFVISGEAEGKEIDETFTSGPKSFDDVQPASEAQFPAQDPSQGELAERLERIDGRLAEVRTQVAALDDEESSLPALMGAAALALAAIALAVAVLGRKGRRET